MRNNVKSGIISIGEYIFETLLAISAEEQSQGLMYVDPPAPIMTFPYKYAGLNQYWMANTKCPLDIVFCLKGKITEICYGEPYSTRIIGSKISDLVIELPYGTLDKFNIKLGFPVKLIKY